MVQERLLRDPHAEGVVPAKLVQHFRELDPRRILSEEHAEDEGAGPGHEVRAGRDVSGRPH